MSPLKNYEPEKISMILEEEAKHPPKTQRMLIKNTPSDSVHQRTTQQRFQASSANI
jgi:hypothetical protein